MSHKSPPIVPASPIEEKRQLLARMRQTEIAEQEMDAQNTTLRRELERVKNKLQIQHPLPFSGFSIPDLEPTKNRQASAGRQPV